jgi:hypothetical protein
VEASRIDYGDINCCINKASLQLIAMDKKLNHFDLFKKLVVLLLSKGFGN